MSTPATRRWLMKIRLAQHATHATLGGVRYARIPYTHEAVWAQEQIPVPSRPCHDCAVLPGQLHVPGCDGEACPKCLDGQRISCGCAD